jgi:hypothetical protein
MKKLSTFNCILLTVYCLLFTSCIDEFLTREPKNLLSEESIWGDGGDRTAIMALLANYYDNIPFDPGSEVGSYGRELSKYCDESMHGYSWGAPYTPTMTEALNDPYDASIQDDSYGQVPWPYSHIRNINDFLERIVKADIEDKDRFVAEAYFIRAFHYFNLVKRYGGVPLITHTQAYDPDNFDALKVPRSMEEEVWDFVAQDADSSIARFNRCKTVDAVGEPYRVNKYAAYALKSRAMLYAGSIAKYGTVQLKGLVGIPSEKAADFFRRSLEASDSVIRSGKYKLYDKGGNTTQGKADNFQQLFLDKTMHEEAIALEYFSGPKFGNFDYLNAAPSYKVDWGCSTNPTLELVEAFEYIDGTPGTLKIADKAGGIPIPYAKPEDLFKDKDPRFFATILYPGCPWQGSTVEIRQGVVVGGTKQSASGFGDKLDGITVCGKDGMIVSGDCTETGFYIKKFMDPVNKVDERRSETPQLAMRYAEVLLNYAEAATELGVESANALARINDIRTRAGIATKTSITLEDVRHERQVELAFENHRFWDIRRWRIAHTMMNNRKFQGLYPWLDINDGNYYFETGNAAREQAKTFLEIDYYFKIPGVESNEKLIQNPGH